MDANTSTNAPRRIEIGIIGRQPPLLERALATAADLKLSARGTTDDATAIAWVSKREITALVIGGGVEPISRRELLALCADYGVTPLEVFGPDSLRAALATL